jgi:hypothetical protein
MDDLDYNKELDEDGLNYIVQRYKEVHNKNVKYKYIEEYGIYVFVDADIDEETLNDPDKLMESDKLNGYCSADSTLGQAINKLDSQLDSSDDDLSQTSVGGNRRGLNRAANAKPINLNINEEEFEEVLDKLTSIEGKAAEESEFTGIASSLTGELQSFYSANGKIKNDEIKFIKEYVGDLKVKVSSCVDMIKDTDEGLRQMLGPIIDQLFSLGYNKVYQEQTVEEQKQYLTDMIAAANETLNQLKEAYEEFKRIGYDDFQMVFPLLSALGLIEGNNVYDGEEFDYETLSNIVDYCTENKVFERFINYLNGGSFESTLYEIYGKKDYYKNIGANIEQMEMIFIEELCLGYDSRGESYNPIDVNDSSKYNEYRNYVKNFLVEQGVISRKSNGKYGLTVDIVKKVSEDLEKYKTLVEEIATLEYSLKELKKELKLADYEIDKNSREYWKYLTQTYSGEDVKKSVLQILQYLNNASLIKDVDSENYGYYGEYPGDYNGLLNYLTQDEYALIMYYLNNDPSKIDGYLQALHDTLNQRKGFDLACKSVYENGGVGVLEAFGDGIIQWFDNVESLLSMGDSPVSAYSYKNMFILQLLEAAKKPKGQRGEFEEILANIEPGEATANKISYTIANQIGSMAVPMIAGAVIGKLVGPATFSVFGHSFKWAALAGSTLVGMGAAGSAMAQAYSRGDASRLAIITYGLLNGLSETTLMMLLSKIPIIGGAFKESEAQGLLGLLKSGLGEAKEEFIQSFIENILNSIYFGDEFNFGATLNEATISAFYGFLTSAVMSGGYVTFNVMINGVLTKVSGNPKDILRMLEELGGNIINITESVIRSFGLSTAKADSVSTFESTLQGVSTQDGIVNLDEAALKNYNIRLFPGESMIYDQNTGEFFRIDKNGDKHPIPNDLFLESNLRNSDVRLERVEIDGVEYWVDRITGIKTETKPTYNWDDVNIHLNGERTSDNGRGAGLHFTDSFIDQFKNGTIQIVVDNEIIIYPRDCKIDSTTGNMIITKSDGTTVIIKPDSNGNISVNWGYAGATMKNSKKFSTLFPSSWTESDVKAALDAFYADMEKEKPKHYQTNYNKERTLLTGAYYSYEYTNPRTGETILLEIQIENGKIKSIYPKSPSGNTKRPNTFN